MSLKESIDGLPSKFDSVLELSNTFNSDVEKLQKFLKDKNYFLGIYGAKDDGVDGKYGKNTKEAHKAYLENVSSDDYNKKVFKELLPISNTKSKKVEFLQKILKSKGYGLSSTDVDGIYGKKTKLVHKAFLDGVNPDEVNKLTDKKIDVIKVKQPSELKTDVDKSDKYDVVFSSGQGDANYYTKLLEKNLPGKKIKTHVWTDLSGLLKSIEKNPDAVVVLYSAGAKWSKNAASLVDDKSKIFIVEPWNAGGGSPVTPSVIDAVNIGVPNSNVITGPERARGFGIVQNSTPTPKGKSHFEVLDFVGNLVSSKLS